MVRSIRVGIFLIVPMALAAPVGCVVEADSDRHLPITGTVTYNGSPVKMGTIHFLPMEEGGSPATGAIANGEIKDVFTRKRGDGIKSGKYQITITPYDKAFLESGAKRDANGPDPLEVAKAVDNFKAPIPLRYSNSRESGLTAEFSPSHRTLHLELVD
jgi:hypothetical protein